MEIGCNPINKAIKKRRPAKQLTHSSKKYFPNNFRQPLYNFNCFLGIIPIAMPANNGYFVGIVLLLWLHMNESTESVAPHLSLYNNSTLCIFCANTRAWRALWIANVAYFAAHGALNTASSHGILLLWYSLCIPYIQGTQLTTSPKHTLTQTTTHRHTYPDTPKYPPPTHTHTLTWQTNYFVRLLIPTTYSI